MKFSFVFILLSITMYACVGCAASLWSLEAARKEFLQTHPDISPELAEAVRDGRLEKGMTPEMVKVVYGFPGLLRRKGSPKTSGAWGYFITDAVSHARSLQSYGLVEAQGVMTLVYFKNNIVTHWETYDNVSENSFHRLARTE